MANNQEGGIIEAISWGRPDSDYDFSAAVSDKSTTFTFKNDGIKMSAIFSTTGTGSARIAKETANTLSYHCASASQAGCKVTFAVENMRFFIRYIPNHITMDMTMFKYTNYPRCFGKMYVTRWANILLQEVQALVKSSGSAVVDSKLLEELMRRLYTVCKPKNYYSKDCCFLEKELVLLDYHAGLNLLNTSKPKKCRVHCARTADLPKEQDCIVLSQLLELGEIRVAA